MKRIPYLILVLLSSLPALTCCRRSPQDASAGFDILARYVPADATQVFFLDFKPDGEMGRHWERLREQLEARPKAKEALDALYGSFPVREYGLDEWAAGAAVNLSESSVNCNVIQVSDEQAAGRVVLDYNQGLTLEQEEYDGQLLYYGRKRGSYNYAEWRAWTIRDGLLFHCQTYNQEALPSLEALLGLSEADSLAALDSWKTLRERLPANPLGLIFINPPPQIAPDDMSLGAALGRQFTALALAAVPEKEGIRVEIVGALALQADAPAALRSLFTSPAIDPTAWPELPANAAMGLMAHDASAVWSLLNEAFSLNVPDAFSDALHLDVGADLASAAGSLTGDFAFAFTPPLPDQPISSGLPAAQMLIVGRDVPQAKMADVQAVTESRGAVWGAGEREGIALQIQVGAEAAGYAISYGFDGDTLLFGSSPDIVGQAAAARREGQGLVESQAFQAVRQTLPDDPTIVLYLNIEPLLELYRVNTPPEDLARGPEYLVLEPFQALGLGLRLQSDRLDGVLYFLMMD